MLLLSHPGSSPVGGLPDEAMALWRYLNDPSEPVVAGWKLSIRTYRPSGGTINVYIKLDAKPLAT